MDRDRKKTGVIAEMRRSQLVFNLVNLVGEGAIGMSDLKDFSEDLQTCCPDDRRFSRKAVKDR